MMKMYSWDTQMSDETKETGEEIVQSPTELTAREQGWVNKEEWVADGKDAETWRPAKEFVDRGELYKSIHANKRDLKQTQATLAQTQATLTALQKHHAFVFEKAQKQALEELKREKRQAIKNEDFEKLETVEEDIEKLQEQHKAEKEAFVSEQHHVSTGPHPDFVAWTDKNDWYKTDEDLREYADFKGIKYTQKNPGVSPQEVLEYVSKEVKKQFPEKFGVKKAAPNAVLGVNKTNSANRKVMQDDDLSETELDIMKELVSSGVMTEKQYRADLKKVKDR